ncbi:hypothetical protein ABIA32_006627 [Streptacidiphilus sp. MAP12-20]
MQALRHAYASVLLDEGETIKALAEYLGHADAGFTLRTDPHLVPSSSPEPDALDPAFAPEAHAPTEPAQVESTHGAVAA